MGHLAAVFAVLCMTAWVMAQEPVSAGNVSVILGRPTDKSVVVSLLSATDCEGVVEYGMERGKLQQKTAVQSVSAGVPVEFEIGRLEANTRYSYQLSMRRLPGGEWQDVAMGAFQTQRAAGSTFTFALQGDSHPERPGKMFDAELYKRTLLRVAGERPDFYVMMGDDFSIERLIERKTLSQAAVDAVYAQQRKYLDMVGRLSALFLVNGNHEQAAKYLLDGTEANAAVLAARARNNFYPLPSPDGFYGGDAENVKPIGFLRDYYSWTWGDALFVVIDPYWHSAVAVDNEAGVQGKDAGEPGGNKQEKKRRDLWEITLGETQYRWLTKTLGESKARWKFVFSHHVLGTGRGGIEMAGLFEWGGKDRRGVSVFAARRPGWDLPIHDLFVKHGVTIFFQGHDHLYARQELDGVIYQSAPNPADPTYTAFNKEAYRSGVILPNSGHLRVSVGAKDVLVEYVRSYLAKDATPEHPDGELAHSYRIRPRATTERGN